MALLQDNGRMASAPADELQPIRSQWTNGHAILERTVATRSTLRRLSRSWNGHAILERSVAPRSTLRRLSRSWNGHAILERSVAPRSTLRRLSRSWNAELPVCGGRFCAL